MNLEEVLNKTAIIVPQIIEESDCRPEDLTSLDVEKVSLIAIRNAIKSVMPDAEANHIGGQRFPDITVTLDDETEGVEVKSTRTSSSPWTVPGGSIMEGNRIDGVNDVWLLFTKLAEKVETKARPYVDAICDLAVTHSPRYILSMESEREKSLFARLGICYEVVRKSEHPFDFFREYLEQKARETGGTPWWSEREPEAVAPPLIRFWEDLDEDEASRILAEGWALFAGDLLFGSTRDKYKAFALYLVRKHAIISTSLRDKFTAGGQEIVIKRLGKSPRVFLSFANLLPRIREVIKEGAVVKSRSWDQWKAEILESAKANGQFPLLNAIFKKYS